MFFYTGRITDFRRPTTQSSSFDELFAFLEVTCSESSSKYFAFTYGNMTQTCLIRKNAESVERLNLCSSVIINQSILRMCKMYQTEKIVKFGGINKLKDAIQTKLLDDVYCWETGKWCTQRYWLEVADKNLTGITLSELMEGTPLDATHYAGPLFNKMDEGGRVFEWVPQQNRWLYVGWHPNAAINPIL